VSENPTDRVKDLYERWGAAFARRPDMPLDEWRELIEEWPVVASEPGEVDYVEADANGVRAMWITPKASDTDRVVLGFHGGGFVTGSMYTHRKLFAHLAKAVGSRALLIDYRRAPEHTHPAPVEDALTAYRWLLDQGIDASHVAFVGDSAGGGMVVTTMLLARDRNVPLPAAGMPLSPWLDLQATGSSYELNAEKDALLSKEFSLTLAGMFLGETGDPRDPLASAVHGELAGLPPMYIQATRCWPTTAAASPRGPRRLVSTSASISSPDSSTRSRWRSVARRSPMTPSCAWRAGSVPIWGCEREDSTCRGPGPLRVRGAAAVPTQQGAVPQRGAEHPPLLRLLGLVFAVRPA
jgi:epsilon-lactone hydrolase